MGSLKGEGQWDHSFRDDEGNDKTKCWNISYAISITLFWSPGDPACDLPDPMEHAYKI